MGGRQLFAWLPASPIYIQIRSQAKIPPVTEKRSTIHLNPPGSQIYVYQCLYIDIFQSKSVSWLPEIPSRKTDERAENTPESHHFTNSLKSPADRPRDQGNGSLQKIRVVHWKPDELSRWTDDNTERDLCKAFLVSSWCFMKIIQRVSLSRHMLLVKTSKAYWAKQKKRHPAHDVLWYISISFNMFLPGLKTLGSQISQRR